MKIFFPISLFLIFTGVFRINASNQTVAIYDTTYFNSLKEKIHPLLKTNPNSFIKNCIENIQLIDSNKTINEKWKNEYIANAYRHLEIAYKIIGNYQTALIYFKKYILYRDSIFSAENSKNQIQQEIQYEFDKKRTEDSIAFANDKLIREAEIAKQKIEIIAKKNMQYALYGGLVVVIIFSFFILNRFKIARIQKNIIEKQKAMLESKQKEVLDSIYYAKRIQNCMMPKEKYILKKLKELKK